MPPTFSLSLQRKFVLIAFISVTCLTLAMGFFAASKTKSALFNATKQKGKMLAQTVSALIINELIYEQLGLVEEGGLIDNYVRELSQREELELRYVAVVDNNFQVISHSDFSEFGKTYKNPFKLKFPAFLRLIQKFTHINENFRVSERHVISVR